MLISTTAKVKWGYKNKKYFVNLGYDFTNIGDEFEVKVEDLLPYSHALVVVKCDYCGDTCVREWRYHIRTKKRSPIEKDTCLNQSCVKKKLKECCLEKYGVDSASKLPETKEKVKMTGLRKYGVPYFCQTEEWKSANSGENNHRWKGDDATCERQERNDPQYKLWRSSVFQRDNYTCQCCGAKNIKGSNKSITLHAHHIKNWKDNTDNRFDDGNGITLCSECHYAFHSRYGKHNNTKEQLDGFIKSYTSQKLNEDKEIC